MGGWRGQALAHGGGTVCGLLSPAKLQAQQRFLDELPGSRDSVPQGDSLAARNESRDLDTVGFIRVTLTPNSIYKTEG